MLLVFTLLAAPAFGAATGRIVGPDGAPISGAQVCEFVDGAPKRCVTADANGVYRLDKPERSTLLVRVSGYVPTTIDASPLSNPVRLERAARLMVTVVDAATRVPVPSGRVMIDSPSGERIGDYVPFNKNGVRISTLAPGNIFVRVEADGYAPSGPMPVKLVSGNEESLTVPLKKTGR